MCDTCSTPADQAAAGTVTTEYAVTGMTCGHCATSVGNALDKLDGVETVAVDVAAGRVTIGSAAALDEAVVRAAVDEAGYELTGRI